VKVLRGQTSRYCVGRVVIWIDNGLGTSRVIVWRRIERRCFEKMQLREKMSRGKETALTTCLYPRRRSRHSVGHHAFEINRGGKRQSFSQARNRTKRPCVSRSGRNDGADQSQERPALPISQRTAFLGDAVMFLSRSRHRKAAVGGRSADQ